MFPPHPTFISKFQCDSHPCRFIDCRNFQFEMNFLFEIVCKHTCAYKVSLWAPDVSRVCNLRFTKGKKLSRDVPITREMAFKNKKKVEEEIKKNEKRRIPTQSFTLLRVCVCVKRNWVSLCLCPQNAPAQFSHVRQPHFSFFFSYQNTNRTTVVSFHHRCVLVSLVSNFLVFLK